SRALRCSAAALPVRRPRELCPGVLRSSLLELARSHGLLRGGVRRRGHPGRPRHGAHSPPALSGPPADARGPLDPLGAVPRGGRNPVARAPRRGLRRPQRSPPSPRADRQLHRILRERIQRAERPGVGLHVEPGALRHRPVPGRPAGPPRGPSRLGSGRRRRVLARAVVRRLARPQAHDLPRRRPLHRQRLSDARPDLRDDHGWPGRRHHFRGVARLQDRVRLFQVRPGHRDPLHADRALRAAHSRVPAAHPRQVRGRGVSVTVRALPRHAGASRRLAHRVVLYGLVLALAGWILGPFVWLFVTSVSYQRTLLARPFPLIPPEITAENYRMIFGLVRFHAEVQASRILPALLNSVIVALAVTTLNLVIGSAAGYAYARCAFPLKRVSLYTILFTRMLPTIVLMPAFFLIPRPFGSQHTLPGLAIASSSSPFPSTVWIMKPYCETPPRDLEGGGLADGSPRLQVYRRIVLPMSGPGLVA